MKLQIIQMEKEDLPFEETNLKQLKKIFSEILQSKVKVELDEENVEKEVFVKLIGKLEKLVDNEYKTFKLGFDLSPIVDPYVRIIEILLKLNYGPEVSSIIEFYLFDRKSKTGKLLPFKDNSGIKFTLKTPEDLWGLIQKIGFL